MGVKVKKSTEKPESTEILAEAIVRIGEAMEKLSESGLNERAIIILVQAETRINRHEIKAVIDALKRLRGWYCRT